jgi:tyrosine-protein phosphatase SIW14
MPTHPWTLPNDNLHAGVDNFGIVAPGIWRGSQPTAEGFLNLEQAGVKTILNLRYHHDDLPLLRETKLNYIRIPMRAWDPDQGEFAQLTMVMKTLDRLLQDPAAQPVFIHCAQGRDRTGYAVATYRRLFQDWSADDALEEMFGYGFNRLWIRNPGHIRKLDLELMREMLKRAL